MTKNRLLCLLISASTLAASNAFSEETPILNAGEQAVSGEITLDETAETAEISTEVAQTAKNVGPKIKSEIFKVGATFGILNIQDFTSEVTYGITGRVQASENFFLQSNYIRTDVEESLVEKATLPYLSSDDRSFSHFNLLIGRTILQGEFIKSETVTRLSTLYVVGGVGETKFGGEQSFTYTVGIGYNVALTKEMDLTIDFRDYIYNSSLIEEDNSTHNTHFSAGITYQF